jgi:zinc protease
MSQSGETNAPVLLPVADDPTISLALWFRVGSQDDPPGREGLAYLTGQMVAAAATRDLAYDQILTRLYPMAADYAIRVDKEMTVLTGRAHRDRLDDYLALFSAAYLRPAWRADDFERHRADAINYLENTLRYSSDEELGKAALQEALFAGTPYAHPPEGTVQGLKAVTLEDVRAFYARHYTRANATIGVGGGFEPGLPAALDTALAELPEGAANPRRTDLTPRHPLGRNVTLVAKPDADASISLGFPLHLHRGEPDFYALWIANSWLGEHRNSVGRLYEMIRAARGLNYGDYSYIEAFPEGGMRSMPPTNVGRRHQIFEIWLRTLPNAQALFALRAALYELTQLIQRGLSQSQFELTRKFLKKYVLHFAPTTAARLGYAIDDRYYGIPSPGHLTRFGQQMDALSLTDVNRAIRKHLQTENMHIAIVTGAPEQLTSALVSGQPTPVQYPSTQSAELLARDQEIAAYPLRVDAGRIRTVAVADQFEHSGGTAHG